jgi:hypothetical protein
MDSKTARRSRWSKGEKEGLRKALSTSPFVLKRTLPPFLCLLESQKEAFKALLREGVNEAVAVRLVSKFSAQEILQQIEWLDYRKPTKNRAGMLVKAIEEGWAAPLEWEEEQRGKERQR